jgi:hypothetical protein
VDLDLILHGGDDIENGLNSILVNAVASTIPKWWTFNLTDWWIWTECCMEVMALNITLTPYYLIS